MPLKAIQTLLRETIGLDIASIGEPAFRRAVATRLAARSLTASDDYLEYLLKTPNEIQDLIEAVVVPETWFFREPKAFATMVESAGKSVEAHPTRVLRLLSLPCSTGEEPYSMAMALLDAGFEASRFVIDAVDVSDRAVTQAIRGVYGRNSFRGDDLSFKARHFKAAPGGHHISEEVKSRVVFLRANMLEPDFIPGAALYDVIFCRNMLIYFDDAARKVAVAVLKRLLRDDGTIFVGPSEAGLMLDHGLASAKVPLAFAFRKALPTVPAPLGVPMMKVAPAPPPPMPNRMRKRGARVHVSPPPVSPTSDTETTLESIGRVADQGQLEEAGRACEAYLREREPTADALLLLGLIRDAAGNSADAGRYYRKALYLEPNHPQALAHLALLLEKEGDAKGARVMNERLRRREKG
jgi:chemotaxis protein methyltransferase WspC